MGRVEDPAVLDDGADEPVFSADEPDTDSETNTDAEQPKDTEGDPHDEDEPTASPQADEREEPDTDAKDTSFGPSADAGPAPTPSKPPAAVPNSQQRKPRRRELSKTARTPRVAVVRTPSDDDEDGTGFKRTGHPVRDRMLAKAAEAEQTKKERSAHADAALGSVDDELLKIASTSRPRPAEQVRIAGAPLSSAAVLLLGTVFGLAGFASLFALLLEFAPRDDTVPALVLPTPAPSIAPTVAPTADAFALQAPPPREKLPGPWRITEAKSGQRVIRGKIGQNPFLRAIQEAGLAKTQAYRVYTALKDERNLDRCSPTHEFAALLNRSDGRVLAFEYIVSKEEVYQAREGDDGLLTGKRLDLKVERGRVQGAMIMASASFADGARAAHFDPGLGPVLNKALEGHSSVEEFQLGDRLRVVAQEVTVLGEFYRYSGIEALEYLPAKGEPIRIYYFPTKKDYYDRRGRAPGEGGWRRPVKGAPITSKFNPNRMHPILKKRMPHNGTDFGAPTGTPIYAASSGEIIKLGNYGANGNFIAIKHRAGYETGYSHLSRFEPKLKVGDKVKRMQAIGYVGSTGRSTGPHLHFSAKKDGKFIDAESLGLDALTTLPKAQLALFRQVQQKYDDLLDDIPLPPALPGLAPDPAASEDAELGVASAELDFGGEAEAEDTATRSDGAETVTAPPGVALPTAAPVVPAAARAEAPATPTPKANAGASLYLTDRELMESQSLVDDGEVAE